MSRNDERRPRQETPPKVITTTDASVSLGGFDAGILADAWLEGQARSWRRRAQAFRAAKPRRDEFHGRQTPEQVNARWTWLDQIERACLAKADLCAMGSDTGFMELLEDIRSAA